MEERKCCRKANNFIHITESLSSSNGRPISINSKPTDSKKRKLALEFGPTIPALEIFNSWWNRKFIAWAFDTQREKLTFEIVVLVGCTQAFAQTIVLGSSQIDEWTVYFLILADTLMSS